MINNKNTAHMLILSLLLLPGCFKWKTKKERESDTNKTTITETTTVYDNYDDDVTIPVASNSTKSFFDENSEEFVFSDDFDEFDNENIFSENDFDFDDMDDISTDIDLNTSNEYAHLQDDSISSQQGFRTVYFDFDKHTIRPDQKDVIVYNAERVKKVVDEARRENKEYRIVLEGHSCHSAGSDTYNMTKSENRAKNYLDELLALGIERDKITCVGRGADIPAIVNNEIVDGDRKEQWPNRRAEIYVKIYG